MIDTIGLNSPPLGARVLKHIENLLIKRQAVDLKTGEKIYELTSNSLPGSYSHGVQVQIIDLYETRVVKLSEGTEVVKEYIGQGIRVESSLHKAMMGHNVYGGPVDFQKSVCWYIGFIEKLLKLKKGTLPNWRNWRVYRVDIAQIYYFENPRGIEQYINSMVQAKYPRGKVDNYGSNGLTVKGRRDLTPKIYHKGPEFRKHDLKVLANTKIGFEKLKQIDEYAQHILRLEVEVKRRILKEKFSDGRNLPKVTDITYEQLLPFWTFTMEKLVKERKTDMEIVRNVHDVQERLLTMFNTRKARTLMNTWYNLTTIGEEQTLNTMAYSTYRKHINYLISAGVSWKGSNVGLLENTAIPADFSPTLDSPYLLSSVSPRIQRLLKKVA